MIETKEDAVAYLRQGDSGSDILNRLDQLTHILGTDSDDSDYSDDQDSI